MLSTVYARWLTHVFFQTHIQMNHYTETTTLDLGAFHSSAIIVKKGTHQICCAAALF